MGSFAIGGERTSGSGGEGFPKRAAPPAVEVELGRLQHREDGIDLDLVGAETSGDDRQEAVLSVPAEHLEPDHSLVLRVKDYVDDPSELDSAHDDAPVEKLDASLHCGSVVPEGHRAETIEP